MNAVLQLSPDVFPMLFGALALRPAPPRRDLLVVAALVFDVTDHPGRDGGQPGDARALAERIGPLLGVSGADLGQLVAIVGQRRLLVDTAERRDVTDDATISAVARGVGSSDALGVLHAVSLLDARNDRSGNAAWRREVVADLVNRVAHVLDGGEMHEVAWPQFPTPEVRELMALPRTVLRGDGHKLIVVAPDRPGLFSRVAGVLSLHGLDVLGAQAHSDDSGMAASEFRVAGPAEAALEWERVIADLRLGLDGRLALESRLAERALALPPARVVSPGSVSIDNAASALATVVEVQATDSPGLLYRITRALADMGLDIRHAKVQTVGDDVLDTFYVRDILGDKVTDGHYVAEIERAVLHELTRA